MTITRLLVSRLLRRPGSSFAVVEFAEVTPDPVVLDPRGRASVTVDVVTSGTARETVEGELAAPDGSRAGLRFAKVAQSPFEESWRAEHALEADAARGVWRVIVRAGDSVAEREFRVVDGGEAWRGSRIGEFDLSPDPVDEGSPLTFSGRLEAGEGKDWAGLGRQRITLTFRADDTFSRREIAETETGESGAFSATVIATESGFWRAEFSGTAEARRDGVGATRSAEVHSTVRGAGARTRITYSVVPSKGRQGRTATHKGTLVVRVEPAGQPGRWDPLPQQRVRLLFDPAGAAASSSQGSTTTGSQGRFTFKKKVPSTGDWQVRFESQAPGTRKSSESPVRRVTAT